MNAGADLFAAVLRGVLLLISAVALYRIALALPRLVVRGDHTAAGWCLIAGMSWATHLLINLAALILEAGR